jgi:type I restriction enzyme S subunit
MISSTTLGTHYPIALLGDLVDFLDHLRKPVSANERDPGPYPYYGANGKQDSVSGFLFDEPLVLVAEDGGFFGDPKKTIAYRVSGKCWVNNHAHVLRPRQSVDIGYLCRHLEQYDVRPFTSGTTRLKLNKSQAQRIPISLPPLPVQKRIAAILDAADAMRAKRRESIEQLESLLQATFLEMFGDPVTNPKEWNESALLGDVADITSGLTKGRKLRNQSTREVPYLAVVNVQDRHLVLDPLKTIEATNAEIDKYRLLRNDLLLTEGGDRDKLGRGTLWQDELPECIHQNHIFRVRLHDERWVPVFLNWLAGSNRGKRYFLSQAKQTTGIASINLSQLKRFPLLLPPLHLQQRFASIVEAIESHKVRLETQYAELDALFASLQVRAFSGDLCSSAVSRQHASA